MSPWMQPISHNLIVKMGLAEKWNHKDIKGQNCSVSGLISFISCRAPQAPDRKVPAVIRQSSWLKAWTAKAIISVPVRGGVVLWNECFLHRNAITARRCDKNIWEPQYCVSKQKYLGNLSGQWRLGRFLELDYDYKNYDVQQWANKWKFRKSKLFFFPLQRTWKMLWVCALWYISINWMNSAPQLTPKLCATPPPSTYFVAFMYVVIYHLQQKPHHISQDERGDQIPVDNIPKASDTPKQGNRFKSLYIVNI